MDPKELIIERWKRPRYKKRPESFDKELTGYNEFCGDKVRFFLITEKNNKIKELYFEGEGCTISMGTADLLCEVARGKSFQEVLSWDRNFILKLLKIPLSHVRIKCALLPLNTLKELLQNYHKE